MNSKEPIKVLCVDDDELVAQILRITLKNVGGFEWLGQLKDAGELAAAAKRERPDIVLLDLCMPGKSPFIALQELQQACPSARAIMLTGYANKHMIDRAIEAGAWGYLSKHDDGWGLVAAIKRVVNGEFVMGFEPNLEYATR